jgi:hypothetical protein
VERNVYPRLLLILNQVNVSSGEKCLLTILVNSESGKCDLSGEKCLPTTVVYSESGKCVSVERNVYPRLLLTLNQVNVSVWREMSTHDLLTLNQVNVFEWREMSTHDSCLL